jgi:predicted secreted protein
MCAGVTFGESDNGKILQVPAGGNLIFQAETNPSTGYDWFAKSFESDLLNHDLENNEYLGFSEDRVGSIGEVRVCLTALSPGQTPLEMDYERPWEAETTEPLKRVRVVVDIQP